MSEQLWTVMDVAAYLRVSRSMVYTLPIRWSKIGNARRYDPADVRLYVHLNQRGAA